MRLFKNFWAFLLASVSGLFASVPTYAAIDTTTLQTAIDTAVSDAVGVGLIVAAAVAGIIVIYLVIRMLGLLR